MLNLEVYTEGAGLNTYKKLSKYFIVCSGTEEFKGDFYSSELDTKYTVYIKDNICN